MMMIARRLERVSDQARNICQEALYLCTGENTKHADPEALRVLFVDKANSTASQMAEAIANSMDLGEFIFRSAGVDPKPIPESIIQFTGRRGMDVSRMWPKAIHEIPNLDHYQVIVALDPQVHRAFPEHPRKVVFLDGRPPQVKHVAVLSAVFSRRKKPRPWSHSCDERRPPWRKRHRFAVSRWLHGVDHHRG